MPSHFRQFTPAEWEGHHKVEDGFDNAVRVNQRALGVVVAHCAGSREEWEARFPGYGHYLGEKISDLPAADRLTIFERLIERDGPEPMRFRIKMSETVPSGATVLAENLVPHVWLGEVPEDVR